MVLGCNNFHRVLRMKKALRQNIEKVFEKSILDAFDEHSTTAILPRLYCLKGNILKTA